MVVIDRYSKYPTFITTPTDYKVNKATHLFIKHIVKPQGVLKSIVSDRDSLFIGHFQMKLFKILGTGLKFLTSLYSQMDGQTEHINGFFEMYLRHYVSALQRDQAKLLDVVQFSYNIQQSEATGKSPFEIFIGLLPMTLNVITST